MIIRTFSAAVGVLLLAAGCYRMQDVGGAGAGPDADTDVDSDTDSDSDFNVFGYVNLAQRTTELDQGGHLTLSAAFYEIPYDPDADSWVETLTTPDGVACDIYYFSGLPLDPQDPLPAQLDGGAIRVGNEGDPPEVLEVEFDGEAYPSDHRAQWDVDNPLPGWLVPGAFQIPFVGDGQGSVTVFDEPISIPPLPEMSLESPQPSDEDGNYVFEWSDNGAGEVVFSLHFNMDWDNASFVCQPDPGAEQILIPQEWIDTYSWGGGELALYSRDQTEVAAGGGLVLLNVTRAHVIPFVSAND